MFHLEYGRFREIPRHLAEIVGGLFKAKTITIPDQILTPAIDILPEIKKPWRFKTHGPVFRYKEYGGVFCCPVIDLSRTGEGFQCDMSKPVDPEKLLEEVRDLTRYAKRISAKRRKYW